MDILNNTDLASPDMAKPLAVPAQPDQRIHAIDALRGLALFGVLAINLETEFRVSIFQQFLSREHEAGLDRQIDAFLTIFIDLKAFALFSLLFGVGLAIQFENLRCNPRRLELLVRRLTALLMFGLIHLLLIWNGDILTEYALTGLLVLPFLFAPLRVMAAGAAIFLLVYIVMPLLPPPLAFPSMDVLARDVAQADRIYRSGNLPAILTFGWSETRLILPLDAYIFPRTVGLFLLGALGWRLDVLRSWSAKRLFAVALPALSTGLLLVLSTHARWYTGWPYLGTWAPVAFSASTVLMALGYAGLVQGIFVGGAGKLLSWAAPVGRMAFTNYILQSVILRCIFYGLHLFGTLDLSTGLALVALVYGGQIITSNMWLKYFRFGPLEWLWRTMMYGEAPSFLRA